MTDQLEADLRTLLTQLADEITADADAGEHAIATRLNAGDAGLAEVVGIRSPRRAPLLVAAAVLLVVAVGAAVLLSAGDDKVDTVRPAGTAAIFTGTGTATEVALEYLAVRLGLSPDMLVVTSVPSLPETAPDHARVLWTFSDLGFAEHRALSFPIRGFVTLRDLAGDAWTVVKADSDATSIDEVERSTSSITVRSSGLAGTSLRLTVHRLNGAVIADGGCAGPGGGSSDPGLDTNPVVCEISDVEIPFATEAVTVRLSVVAVNGDLLTLAEHWEPPATAPDVSASPLVPADATSVPERSFGASATVGDERESAKDVAERVALAVFGETFVALDTRDEEVFTFVDMEGAGGTATAELIYNDGARGEQLLSISPDENKPRAITEQPLSFAVPEPGDLTYAILNRDLQVLFADEMPGVDGGVVGFLSAVGGEDQAGWVSVRLDTPDGRSLFWLSPVGD